MFEGLCTPLHWTHGSAVCVFACLGEQETNCQLENTRNVLEVSLVEGLPHIVRFFGSDGSRQPCEIHDKMIPFIVTLLLQNCKLGLGIDRVLGRKPIP